MLGQEKIISLRMSGRSPEWVFINDWPCETDWFEHGDFATVCTSGDTIALLDLRFLIGLKVSISADSEVRAKALYEAVKSSGAAVVGACHVQADLPASRQSGWTSVFKKSQQSEVYLG